MFLKSFTRAFLLFLIVNAIFCNYVESRSASGSFSVRLNTNKPCTCDRCNGIKTTNILQRPIYVMAESAINEPTPIGRKNSCPHHKSSVEEYGAVSRDQVMGDFQKPIFPSFKPIGDLCDDSETQKTTTVLPAYPGTQRFTIRHSCDAENPTYYQTGSSSYGTNLLNQGSSFYRAYDEYSDFDRTRQHELSFAEQENLYNGDNMPAVPADPVSVTLAYKNLLAPYVAQLTKKNNIQEGRLSFGHRRIPTDGRVHQTLTTTVPEEKLIIVDKPIVELKTAKSTCDCNKNNFDAEAELEVERFEQDNIGSAAVPTYRDLGYDLIGSSGNRFITTESSVNSYGSRDVTSVSSSYDDDEPPCGRLGAPLPDYRPGVVIEHGKSCGCKDSSNDSHQLRKNFVINPRRSYTVQRRPSIL